MGNSSNRQHGRLHRPGSADTLQPHQPLTSTRAFPQCTALAVQSGKKMCVIPEGKVSLLEVSSSGTAGGKREAADSAAPAEG